VGRYSSHVLVWHNWPSKTRHADPGSGSFIIALPATKAFSAMLDIVPDFKFAARCRGDLVTFLANSLSSGTRSPVLLLGRRWNHIRRHLGRDPEVFLGRILVDVSSH
jgi:hypothetical protein